MEKDMDQQAPKGLTSDLIHLLDACLQVLSTPISSLRFYTNVLFSETQIYPYMPLKGLQHIAICKEVR
jgi:hypothetical protein